MEKETENKKKSKRGEEMNGDMEKKEKSEEEIK
jgi:hypothetical protein